jgi:tetratricopeptide (TPR) repeat protein
MANRPSTLEDRRQSLQDRLDTRDTIRQDWQDRRGEIRDNVREDWQDWYGDTYHHHDHWHHGCWHGNWGNWWHHMWDDHTALMVFGTTMWGINRAAYTLGYWGYTNPYYTTAYPIGGDVVLDYSQPIYVTAAPADTSGAVAADSASATTQPAQPGIAEFDEARQAFYDGDYDKAMEWTNRSLASLPNDPIIHEFRALILFAQGKYQEAAATLNSVLAVGPGWDWTTLISLYPNVDVYTKQLRALEAYQRQNPNAADAHFVLAYHYLTAGHNEAAARQLKQVVKLMPQDRVANELLAMVADPEDLPDSVAQAPPTSTDEEGPAVAPADLIGQWSASSAADTSFQLSLDANGSFTWTYMEGGKPQTVKGVYAIDGNVLALELDSGGQMLAQVTPPDQNKFRFQVLGGPASDPGLTFERAT